MFQPTICINSATLLHSGQFNPKNKIIKKDNPWLFPNELKCLRLPPWEIAVQPLPSVLVLSLILCIISSPFSHLPQLEMSKQDDRGSEESANQTSVSQREKFCKRAHCFPDIILHLQLPTPHHLSSSTRPGFPLSPLPARRPNHCRPMWLSLTAVVLE